MIRIVRRDSPLLPANQRRLYGELLHVAFSRSSEPLRRSLRDFISSLQFKRLADDLGFSRDALPTHLDVQQWAGIAEFVASKTEFGSKVEDGARGLEYH